VKPGVWRRYDGVRRRFGIFRKEEFNVRPEVEPFDIEHVVAWLGVRIADKVVSADTEIAALNKFHVRAGGTPLRDDVRIQEALTGWGRTKPLPVKKKPLTGAMIGKSAARWDESSLLGARAAAMLAAGHGGALRGPSELLAMQLPLRVVAQGAEVELQTKTDKHVQHTSVRRIPATALVLVRKYLALSGHSDGWLFRSIRGGGAAARSTDKPVSASTLSNVVKACATTLGNNPADFATHSLRHGAADDFKSNPKP